MDEITASKHLLFNKKKLLRSRNYGSITLIHESAMENMACLTDGRRQVCYNTSVISDLRRLGQED
jgi:hypothetical protein